MREFIKEYIKTVIESFFILNFDYFVNFFVGFVFQHMLQFLLQPVHFNGSSYPQNLHCSPFFYELPLYSEPFFRYFLPTIVANLPIPCFLPPFL